MSVTNLDEILNIIDHNRQLTKQIGQEFDEYLMYEGNIIATDNFKKLLGFDINKSDSINREIQIKIDLILNTLNQLMFKNLNSSQLNLTPKNLDYLEESALSANLTLKEYVDNFKKLKSTIIEVENSNILNDSSYISKMKPVILEELRILADSLTLIRTRIENNSTSNKEYIERFKEETSLIISDYENKIRNLTEKFENQFKKFELNQNKVIKSSELLKSNVDTGLKNLGELNERTQNIELELSKIIGTETEKVKTDLNTSRIVLMSEIESITTEANTKLSGIETAHSDFLNIVTKSGAHELTKNYQEKANEEKKQYETFRTYTARSIGAAIIFTIIILTIPLIEYWGVNPPVDTNYYTILARLTISLMFFVLALYFSKQASKHYESYQENHRTFIQLAALEPFLSRMSADEQKEIRKGLIPSYFNQSADGKFAAKGDEVDMSMMFTFMDKLSNFAQIKKEQKPAETPATETKP
ncbi:hypothetical protein DCO44_09890 [Acinetobacter sp. AM]|uniref:hypothetical protein n=1 Tax=Acinetobacter sp. AM TaxID=2170730 RepID=UPI000DE6A2AF|nr:hypothetical protein [Acinetobacter sp. AM]PWB14214.1 hypothetical protein DCO44_09890 [Acinetobacter sp. AM]